MHFGPFYVIGALCLSLRVTQATNNGPDYTSLPLDTIFPGPWESNIRAPHNKSHITPVKIYAVEGAVEGGESVLQDADTAGGISWIMSPGGLITYEFGENIAGKYVKSAIHTD